MESGAGYWYRPSGAMTELLYALLCERDCADDDLFMRLRHDIGVGVVIDAEVVDYAADYIVVSRINARCTARMDDDRAPGIVLIFGSAQDPESVGLCWDILILLSMLTSGDVWLSTYPEAELARFGEVRSLVLQGKRGNVISARQFDAMVK
jgi:hypothetical protein